MTLQVTSAVHLEIFPLIFISHTLSTCIAIESETRLDTTDMPSSLLAINQSSTPIRKAYLLVSSILTCSTFFTVKLFELSLEDPGNHLFCSHSPFLTSNSESQTTQITFAINLAAWTNLYVLEKLKPAIC